MSLKVLEENDMAMIEFQDVQKYYGSFHALKDINLKIEAGETVVLIGPSGSGKSTLIRTVNGLERIQEGKLIVNGQDLADRKTDMNRIRKNVGMVFQHFNLYANKTILENIMLAPRIVLHRPEEENKKVARQLLDQVGLESQANKYPAQLSGGQQQRIAIARSLAMKPKCLLFDEPTSALDPEMIDDVLNVMKDIANDSDMTMLVVTHEMGFAREVANRVIFMDDGQILEDDSSEKFFDGEPSNERARQFLGKIITH
ncbi:phosphonate-transporting ATPase [Lentilactobacillus diolivorans DSM 14421]|jgi:putative glutamine transport system ATP-binding protein|uniref:Phosphonate-transporting ATPase n=2 Tax=Lentilactobacillus diolivorans TaxID=179838 RepID=A0A0R1SIB3_9LACO|nr:phosphonate-transporting ATPase [Lentilactobacillus diolivorans DSM 14421]